MATLYFRQVSDFFSKTLFVASSEMFFFCTYDGPTIEEFISIEKELYGKRWKNLSWLGLEDEAAKWFRSLDSKKLYKISDEEFEKVILDKWSRARKKENETRKGLFSASVSLFQVHGLIQKEKIVVSIYPSCTHNFMNVNLAKKLQVPAKHIENT